MADTPRDKLTISDFMILVAAVGVGVWGTTLYRGGTPIPIAARPGFPVPPVFLSIPVAAALTWGFLVVPARSSDERLRRSLSEPGTALCAAAATASSAVAIRWSLRGWITPYVDTTPRVHWVYDLYADCVWWSGLGVAAVLVLLILEGRVRPRRDWIEVVRLALAAYWLAIFLIWNS